MVIFQVLERASGYAGKVGKQCQRRAAGEKKFIYFQIVAEDRVKRLFTPTAPTYISKFPRNRKVGQPTEVGHKLFLKGVKKSVSQRSRRRYRY